MINCRQDIVVIGGGVIGMSIAHRLTKAGCEVALIEPDEPGMGASYGNAGTVADYATVPLGTPNVLRSLPRLMLDRKSPLSVHYTTVPGLLPWLVQFAYQSLPGPSRANARALGRLLNNASGLWHELAAEIGASHHLHQRGCLYLYETIGRRGFHVVERLKRMAHEHLDWTAGVPKPIRAFFEERHCQYAKA